MSWLLELIAASPGSIPDQTNTQSLDSNCGESAVYNRLTSDWLDLLVLSNKDEKLETPFHITLTNQSLWDANEGVKKSCKKSLITRER